MTRGAAEAPLLMNRAKPDRPKDSAILIVIPSLRWIGTPLAIPLLPGQTLLINC
jgi:hypothetical protein